jgi:F0F1-type ATP synthase epsilon subunit
MAGLALHVVVRTPHEIVVETDARSLRVPTETGQVGIRPGGEAVVTPVEPGLAIVHTGEAVRYLGTAGGVLRTSARDAVLLTPLAILGDDAAAVLAAMDAAAAGPDPDQALRRAIEHLETGLLREVRRGTHAGRG